MGKKRFTSKTYLKVLIVVGVLALIGGGAGTFATFNATTTNPGNTFATGTLVLSNTVNTGTTCFSTGTGTTVSASNTNACDQAFSTTISKPGDIAGANVTLQNVGSLAATVATLAKGTCTDGNNPSETYHGTGLVCGALNFYVQEWSNAGRTTPFKCWYGGTGSTCSATFASGTQLLSGFTTADISVGPSSPPAFAATGTTGDTRWFTVAVQLPSTADNTYQGRQAQFDLSWTETQ